MAVIEKRGMISCCTPAEGSQSNGRVPWPFFQAGAKCKVEMGFPKLVFGDGPNSSLGAGLKGSPCTMKSPFLSFHVLAMVFVAAMTGWTALVCVLPSCWMKRLTVALTAVLPLPNTSHDMPRRGSRSFQLKTSAPG